MSTITIESEALTTLVTEVAAEAAAAALAKFGVVIQQPKAEAPAKRSASPKGKGKGKSSSKTTAKNTVSVECLTNGETYDIGADKVVFIGASFRTAKLSTLGSGKTFRIRKPKGAATYKVA